MSGPSYAVAGGAATRVDKQNKAAFRSGLAAADTPLTRAAILALPPFLLYDTSEAATAAKAEWVRSTVPVSAIFSDPDNTATVEVWRVFTDENGIQQLKGFTSLSFQGPSAARAAEYWAEEQYVSGAGATELRFVLSALSGGTVSIRVGSF